MNINTAYYSSKGNRPRNEDNISLLKINGNMIAVVADGLGGEGNGDIASLTTVQTVNTQLSKGAVTEEQIQKAILCANKLIIKMQDSKIKMKSTAAVLYIDKKSAIAASVGDTRIYQFRNGKILFQSTDHSVSQMAVSVGEINSSEIRGHIDRNKLTRALGSNQMVDADLTELDLMAGDAFLLCSDGFWEHVLEDEMLKDLSSSKNADEWLNKMCDRVENKISPTGDNHSAIAIILAKKGG